MMVIDVLWPRPDPRYAGDRVGVVAHVGADPFLRVAADYTKNAAARCDLVAFVYGDWSRRNVESSARSFPQTAPIVEVRARQIPGSSTPG